MSDHDHPKVPPELQAAAATAATAIDDISQDDNDIVTFVASKHLQIEPPAWVRTLEFKDVPYPYTPEDQAKIKNECGLVSGGFALTPPFRLLSTEGAQALRNEVERHKPHCMKQNERSMSVRGLGYVSRYVQDWVHCPQVIDFLSHLSQLDLWPHNQVMNHGHTNIGIPGTGRAVDQWHFDSVDCVCIVLVSDGRHMKGGELQVLQVPNATTAVFEQLKAEGIPSELIDSVQLQEAGTCVLVQGSKVMHSVTSVLEAVEPRHTVIIPFTNRNVFSRDPTRLSLYRGGAIDDPIPLANVEYARHKAWRIQGQMEYILEQARSDTHDAAQLADLLGRAAAELEYARQLLLGEISDNPGYFVNASDKVSSGGRPREGLDMLMAEDITESGGEEKKE